MNSLRFFVDGAGGVTALAADGSQDHRVFPGFRAISNSEALEILAPQKTLGDLAGAALALVNAEYTKRIGAFAEAYPPQERESWPVQVAEAQALQADANAKTPWIDQCASARGLERLQLALRILQKDAAYRYASGSLTGIRQWHEDQISSLLEAGEASHQALQAYDATQGWPATDLREPQPA